MARKTRTLIAISAMVTAYGLRKGDGRDTWASGSGMLLLTMRLQF
jgi:hypothetical protein